MSDIRHDPWKASDDEYKAYTAHELARDPSVSLDLIFRNLGKYDQGVADTRGSVINKKSKKK